MLRISERMAHAPEEPSGRPVSENVDLAIVTRTRDLGGFTVRRALPFAERRLVGPFIFFDHMGPARFAPGSGLDVRPHPHIGLATVTYLFEGAIVHRDTLGSLQTIVPGDVNWMTAGRGIAHSERTGDDARGRGSSLHGIQAWVALPTADEETAPSFAHHPASALPEVERPGVRLRVLVGRAYGVEAPIPVLSPMFYVDAHLAERSVLEVPDDYRERAAYVVTGAIECDGQTFGEGTMIALRAGASTRLRSASGAHVMLLGGDALDGERHIWWNFVASSPERIERAKADWKAGRFGTIPGDEAEFIPLPE
jgi:redox-sensitive bicupin YhaK (pirin superfamily)